MTVRRHLVVRGVRTTDQLQQLGLPMAERFERADVVALVGQDNRGLVVKGAEEATLVELFDADPSAGRCMRAVHRVREAAERARPADGVSRVGFFLYYWPDAEGSVGCVADAIERGDGAAVEAAANHFIETALADELSAVLGSRPDASSDAAGHEADGASS